MCLLILTRHMVTTLHCLHAPGLTETLVCTCWKLCKDLCFLLWFFFLSKWVFKRHLKPYTGWTVQIQDLCLRLTIGVSSFFWRKKKKMLENQKSGVEKSIELWLPPVLFCVTTTIMYFSDANFLFLRVNNADVLSMMFFLFLFCFYLNSVSKVPHCLTEVCAVVEKKPKHTQAS